MIPGFTIAYRARSVRAACRSGILDGRVAVYGRTAVGGSTGSRCRFDTCSFGRVQMKSALAVADGAGTG